MTAPDIRIYEELQSTQDEAFALAQKGALPVWGSVLALSQTRGRGQARKKWLGLPGNLMASVLLPGLPPFTGQASAIAVAAIAGASLRKMGFDAVLKWPNDLGRITAKGFCKFAGILVEERNGFAIAGIGINLREAPEQHALACANAELACALQDNGETPAPETFWKKLLGEMLGIWSDLAKPVASWQNLANSMLIWKGEKIIFDEDRQGMLKQIAANGALVVETEKGPLEITHGSIRLAL